MIKKWHENEWPERLQNIKQKPKQLFIKGNSPNLNHKFLCIVGSRKYSDYGRKVCQSLIPRLRGLPITIVSGLAYGIDSLAHKIALENEIETIAFPGSGLGDNVIYPRAHFWLAKEILEKGGALISEFSENESARDYMFPARNRLMAGISDAILIIEAGEKSGTMITAMIGLDNGSEVLAIPGSIFDESSRGTNKLISLGAKIVCNEFDILESLGFDIKNQEIKKENIYVSELEKEILKLIENPKSKDALIEILLEKNYPIGKIIEAFSLLEIKGLAWEVYGKLCQI